jgi:hypothetical protein
MDVIGYSVDSQWDPALVLDDASKFGVQVPAEGLIDPRCPSLCAED